MSDDILHRHGMVLTLTKKIWRRMRPSPLFPVGLLGENETRRSEDHKFVLHMLNLRYF